MNRGVRRRLASLGVWPALLDAADHVAWKLQLFLLALLHLLFSSDKHWLSSSSSSSSSVSAPESSVLLDPSAAAPVVTKRRRVLFVRHAESEWNVVFNRGLNLRALASLLHAVAREWLLLPSGDSVFLDSPLSRRGRFQAQSLRDHVSEAPLCALAGGGSDDLATAIAAEPVEPVQPHRHSPPQTEEGALLRYLCCPLPGSVVAASNLRRAIDTARLASASRLETPGDSIHVLSCLQEIGRNLDTLALSQPHAAHPHEVLAQAPRGEKRHDELLNVAESHGNKAVLGTGRDRLLAFAHWVFQQQKDVVVVYGHSLWFRAFCREFFPSDVQHETKEAKMSNCGVVTFMLEEHSRGGGEAAQYSIQAESFQHLI
ncbi:Histidine phosphatase superfamily, clade-1 [Phytophthora cinnamomi]|uniref:Histidine phosphatase superfamily, clade-1 n=1 Tax=Phytophthora cinnamomi TaxID=4785 RepID=UPI003559DB0E|nr:Histidine phosphatase superfamily, clade-1 [Phytophthora cinnamomi]